MGYKALFLDFYGTLVEEDDVLVAEILSVLAANSPVSSDTRQIGRDWYSKFLALCATSCGDNFRPQRAIEIESLDHVFEIYQIRLSPTIFCEKLFARWQAPPIFEDAAWFLQQNSLPVCLVSNIDSNDILQAIACTNWSFDKVITSEHCRSYKPRPEMFVCALNLMNCQPDEVLHIGDSLSSDVAGAQQLGIATAWLNRKNKPLSNNSPKPTLMVSDFRELLSVL